MNECRYIISEVRGKLFWYVCAPPGYMRVKDGTIQRDGTPFNSGPEWTTKQAHAYEFKSYLSAARVAGKCPSAKVHPILSRAVE